jgi:hypothetical protein
VRQNNRLGQKDPMLEEAALAMKVQRLPVARAAWAPRTAKTTSTTVPSGTCSMDPPHSNSSTLPSKAASNPNVCQNLRSMLHMLDMTHQVNPSSTKASFGLWAVCYNIILNFTLNFEITLNF